MPEKYWFIRKIYSETGGGFAVMENDGGKERPMPKGFYIEEEDAEKHIIHFCIEGNPLE